jgi:hypothetical protein
MPGLRELYEAALQNALPGRGPVMRFRVTMKDGTIYEGMPTTGTGSDPFRGGPFVMHLATGVKKVALRFDEVSKVEDLPTRAPPRSPTLVYEEKCGSRTYRIQHEPDGTFTVIAVDELGSNQPGSHAAVGRDIKTEDEAFRFMREHGSQK